MPIPSTPWDYTSATATTEVSRLSQKPLEGKVVLVTGGARGIGAGIAEVLAGAGARIAIGDLIGGQHSAYRLADREELDATLERLTAAGGQPFSTPIDLTGSDSCKSAVASVLEHFGRLDVLVNNAGVVRSGAISELDERDWDQMFAVNAKGIFLMSRAALPALRESEGAIVNISSVAGLQGFGGMSAYCGSKFAVLGITQSLAQELATDGIRVNAVAPGSRVLTEVVSESPVIGRIFATSLEDEIAFVAYLISGLFLIFGARRIAAVLAKIKYDAKRDPLKPEVEETPTDC